MFFSVITKNLNWEILTKNLVNFKRWKDDMGSSMKSFDIMGVHWEIQFLGGIQEKLRYIGESHKKGELRQFADLKVGGGYGKKKGWWFWGWVNTQMHIMS